MDRRSAGAMKVGRNDACPCGSGKKYKKCCLPQDEANRLAAQRAIASEEDEQEAVLAGRENQSEMDVSLPIAELTAEDFDREDSEDWDDQEELEEISEPPGKKYPKPDENLPKLSAEQEKLIDVWWDRTAPLYKERQVDPLLQRVEVALTELGELFPYMGLHDELIFELGAGLSREGRLPEYINLLKRLRRDQRRTYSFIYGALDSLIIADLVVRNQVHEIPEYFDLFREYPDSQPDYAKDVCDLLAWRSLDAPLFSFCEGLAAPLIISSSVINGSFAMDWLLREAEIPFWERRDSSPGAVSELIAKVKQVGDRVGYPFEFDEHFCRTRIESTLKRPEVKPNKNPVGEIGDALLVHFPTYLHSQENVPWTTAFFLSDLLATYVSWCQKNKKPWVRLTKADIEEFVVYSSRQFVYIKGVRLLGSLQAIAWFGRYAQSLQLISPATSERIAHDCRELFEKGRVTVDSTDPAYRICERFEQLVK